MAATAPAPSALEELRGIVEREQARFPVPGVAIGITSRDGDLTATFGVTSVDHPLPVEETTLFQIGSITKTFLGTLVMRLAEEGRLDLDVPIRTYLPELRLRDADAAARVTLRHCLTHRAGWFGDHFEDHGGNDDALARYVASMAEFEQQVPLESEFAYNNAAFCLAGRVVEVVTGQPIEAALREGLFQPLGLERTFFFAGEVITFRVASGHNVFDGQPRVARPWAIPRAQNAAGGIVSTVGDLLSYARFHMGDGITTVGSRYLSAVALEHMRTPLFPGSVGTHRGIAWSVEDVNGVRIVGHGGATIGQQALFWIAPERQFALAMLTNSSQAAQLQNAITRWSWRRYLGIERPAPSRHDAAPAEVDRVVGRYEHPANWLEIVRDGAGLVLHQHPHGSLRAFMEEPPPTPEPVEVAFARPDRLVILGGPLQDSQVELLGDAAAPLEWVRFGSRLFRRAG